MPAARLGPAVVVRTWLWGWLAISQLVFDLLLAGPYLVVAVLLVVGISLIPALGIGVPITVALLALAFGLGAFERARVQAFTGVRIGRPAPPSANRPWWQRYAFDGRPWRAMAHLAVVSLWGLMVGSVTLVLVSLAVALAALPVYAGALPDGRVGFWFGASLATGWWLFAVGVSGLVLLPLVARGLVTVDVVLARWLLGPSRGEQVQVLAERVETLTQTREDTVDSVELERRRIERDLHDGPQQRLVAIAMDLGMARTKLDSDPDGARGLLDKAHAASKEAIVEMRQVARGIHPPVLTDRGLDAALSALAARSPVPVTVRIELARRPSPTLEAIAYFCVSEALTNVAKHSRARAASVEVRQVGPVGPVGPVGEGALVVQVRDDGVGGADPQLGTGLVGLRQRVAAVDGTIDVASPVGGPTVVTVRLPERASRNPYPATQDDRSRP
jgi:signal transduction histidine kinase